MKYLQALNEKKLEKNQLTKKAQAKIDALEKLVDKLQEEDIDEDKVDDYKQVVEEMDEEIASEIQVFDLEKYSNQLQRLEKAHQARKKSDSEPQPKKIEQKIESVKTESEQRPINRPTKIEIKPEPEEQEPEEIEVEEIKDFEKRGGGARPKKLNVGLGLISLGVLFLTGGLVYLARNKK